jgi:hypothetical protein
MEADLWGEFIADALDLLDEGHALLRTSAEWASFITGCYGASPTEPEITSGLGDRMRRLRNEAAIDSRRDRIQISYESPTPGDERHGIRKSKADFRFEKKFEAGVAVAFVVEAKPLRSPRDLTARYLGAEGMGCFIDRQPPYSRDLAAGMVGYTLGKPRDWSKSLEGHLKPMGGAHRRARVHVTPAKSALVSDHPRTALGLIPVTMIHSVLEFN